MNKYWSASQYNFPVRLQSNFYLITWEAINNNDQNGFSGRVKGLITLILPALILERVPTSKTGVFPVTLLSWRGPSFGLWRPSWAVLPRINQDIRSNIWSTICTGNHLSNFIDTPKVDIPSISWGKTCTYTTHHKNQKGFPIRSPQRRKKTNFGIAL